MEAALREAAGNEGRALTVEFVAVSRCVSSRDHVANAHLPEDVGAQLVAALDADDADEEPGLEEGEQMGAVYRSLNYGGSTVRGSHRHSRGWTGERMCGTRQAEHHHCHKEDKHHSPRHHKEAKEYKKSVNILTGTPLRMRTRTRRTTSTS